MMKMVVSCQYLPDPEVAGIIRLAACGGRKLDRA